MKQAFEDLSILNKYPTFNDRAAYEAATGQPCPAWNEHKPPKCWFDPKPVKAMVVAGVPYAVYSGFLGIYDSISGDGLIETFAVSIDDAKAVNIAPTGPNSTNIPGADAPATPIPLNPLSATQRIVKRGAVAAPTVQNTDVPAYEETTGTNEILDRVRSIEAKVDKLVAKVGA